MVRLSRVPRLRQHLDFLVLGIVPAMAPVDDSGKAASSSKFLMLRVKAAVRETPGYHSHRTIGADWKIN